MFQLRQQPSFGWLKRWENSDAFRAGQGSRIEVKGEESEKGSTLSLVRFAGRHLGRKVTHQPIGMQPSGQHHAVRLVGSAGRGHAVSERGASLRDSLSQTGGGNRSDLRRGARVSMLGP